jgi:hypothetical protein
MLQRAVTTGVDAQIARWVTCLDIDEARAGAERLVKERG